MIDALEETLVGAMSESMGIQGQVASTVVGGGERDMESGK